MAWIRGMGIAGLVFGLGLSGIAISGCDEQASDEIDVEELLEHPNVEDRRSHDHDHDDEGTVEGIDPEELDEHENVEFVD